MRTGDESTWIFYDFRCIRRYKIGFEGGGVEKFAYRFLLHLSLNVSPTEKHQHHHHPPPLCPQHLLLLFQLNIFVHLRVVVFFVCAALCCSSNRTSPLSTPTYLLHEMLIYSLLSAASACVYNPPTNQPTYLLCILSCLPSCLLMPNLRWIVHYS